MSTSIRPTTIVAATVGTALAGVLAYAVYFDYKRRTDLEFRRAIKRERRREARIAKTQAEEAGSQQLRAIKAAVTEAQDEGFPTDGEERETYFMTEVGNGEKMCQEGADEIETALCFYRALKVYPAPQDLMSIYDKTVPKPILDILAEMIAVDPALKIGAGAKSSSSRGSDAGSHGIDD